MLICGNVVALIQMNELNDKVDETEKKYDQSIQHMKIMIQDHQREIRLKDEELDGLYDKIKELNKEVVNKNKTIDELRSKNDEQKKKLQNVSRGSNPSSTATVKSSGNGSNNDNSNIGEWMNFKMTSYTAKCRGCTGYTYHQGIDVRNTIYHNGLRVIAVDPSVISFGSVVQIKREDGTKFKAIALDKGGAIKGKLVDLLVTDRQTALNNGREKIQIRVIK